MKITFRPALLALACAAGLNTTVFGQVTNVISYTTFEVDPDGRPRWPWGYFYQWVYDPVPVNSYQTDTWFMDPPDLTNTVEQFTFDNSGYTPVPSGGGYGTGFGAGGSLVNGAIDPAMLSTNREDYIMSWDARVEGLLAGVLAANGEMQAQFDAPDDTIDPPDGNTDADRIIQVNLPFQVGTNWAHYRFTLDNGSIGAGSEENLVRYASLINSVNYDVNFHQPDPQFGFDADNYVWVDNIKLEVVTRPASTSPPPPVVEFPIVDWNFDDKPVWYSWPNTWGGWSSTGAPVYNSVNAAAAGYGVGGSNGYVMGMDNSAFAGNPPAWAGGNTGCGGPGNYTLFDAPDMTAYRILFDARVEGLAPGALKTSGNLVVFLNTPDGTLGPTNGNSDQLLRLEFPIANLGSNWQQVAFVLSKGTAGDGTSKTNFPAYFNKINGLTIELQITSAASEAEWGYDTDNALIIDNFRVVRQVVGLPPLSLTVSNNNAVVTWGAWIGQGYAQLQQSATGVQGPYTNVANATNSPGMVPLTAAPKFFRTQWVPPL